MQLETLMRNLGERVVAPFIPALAWRRARTVFVLSSGRCGTQTLARLLNLSTRMRAFHEREPRLLRETSDAFYNVFENPEPYIGVFRKAFANRLGYARLTGKVYCDTSNRLTFLAPTISTVLPHSIFIHLYRHPADVIRSGMRRGWYGGHDWDAFRIKPVSTDAGYCNWDEWDPFNKICWSWAATNQFAFRFSEQISTSRILRLRFEDLMNVDTREYERVFEFLNVECPAHEQICSVLDTRHNQQKVGAFPELSGWTREQRLAIHDIAGQMMDRLDYSLESHALGLPSSNV